MKFEISLLFLLHSLVFSSIHYDSMLINIAVDKFDVNCQSSSFFDSDHDCKKLYDGVYVGTGSYFFKSSFPNPNTFWFFISWNIKAKIRSYNIFLMDWPKVKILLQGSNGYTLQHTFTGTKFTWRKMLLQNEILDSINATMVDAFGRTDNFGIAEIEIYGYINFCKSKYCPENIDGTPLIYGDNGLREDVDVAFFNRGTLCEASSTTTDTSCKYVFNDLPYSTNDVTVQDPGREWVLNNWKVNNQNDFILIKLEQPYDFNRIIVKQRRLHRIIKNILLTMDDGNQALDLPHNFINFTINLFKMHRSASLRIDIRSRHENKKPGFSSIKILSRLPTSNSLKPIANFPTKHCSYKFIMSRILDYKNSTCVKLNNLDSLEFEILNRNFLNFTLKLSGSNSPGNLTHLCNNLDMYGYIDNNNDKLSPIKFIIKGVDECQFNHSKFNDSKKYLVTLKNKTLPVFLCEIHYF